MNIIPLGFEFPNKISKFLIRILKMNDKAPQMVEISAS